VKDHSLCFTSDPIVIRKGAAFIAKKFCVAVGWCLMLMYGGADCK